MKIDETKTDELNEKSGITNKNITDLKLLCRHFGHFGECRLGD